VAARPSPPPHPSIFARHYERAFFEGLTKVAAGEGKAALAAFEDADQSDDKHRAISGSPGVIVGEVTRALVRVGV
jgi:hypothetical protein